MDPARNPYSPGAVCDPSLSPDAIDPVRIGRLLFSAQSSEDPPNQSSCTGCEVSERQFYCRVFDTLQRVADGSSPRSKPTQTSRFGTLGEALHSPLADLARPSLGARLAKALKTAISFKASYDSGGTWNFGVDLSETRGGGADTGTFETDLRKLVQDLAGAAEEEGIGLALLIDEAQDLAKPELEALCGIAHAAAQDGWRVLFAMAGLPSLPRLLAEANHAERFDFEPVEKLNDTTALEALRDPATAQTSNGSQGRPSSLHKRAPVTPIFFSSSAEAHGTKHKGHQSPTATPVWDCQTDELH